MSKIKLISVVAVMSLIFTFTFSGVAMAKSKLQSGFSTVPAKSLVNPFVALSRATQTTFVCVLRVESHSTIIKPNPADLHHDNGAHDDGEFQIWAGNAQGTAGTWAEYAVRVGVKVSALVATFLQQAKVAIAIWRADGFSQWKGDGCV